jgi:hypothetical protein
VSRERILSHTLGYNWHKISFPYFCRIKKAIMGKFNSAKQQLLAQDITEENIDYAILSVKDGVRREVILESLMSDYRGMDYLKANNMLEDLYEAYGGEFRKENRTGYFFGIALLLIGIAALLYIIPNWNNVLNGQAPFIRLAAGFGGFCLIAGGVTLYKALRGNYRHEDDPFKAE